MRRQTLTGGRDVLTRRPSLACVVCAVLILAGCSSTDPSGTRSPSGVETTAGPAAGAGCDGLDDPEAGNRTERPAGLESVLAGLVAADDRTAYADERGLALRNDSVEVTIELEDGADVPPGFDVSVVTRFEDLVQAFVPVCALVPLSEHGNVSFVRSPRRAIPEDPSTGDPEP